MTEPPILWIARDPASLRVLEVARKVAETSTTLLITGESGTGKDQLARLIHESSPRSNAPYLKIDCDSLPAELVESELFGHEKGAFTGAVERKRGRLELAHGGTAVLDEVAALAPAVQAKLLRVLEERAFERLGGTETFQIDVRLIALTNADLEKAVAAGRFREDLYFRLNVLTIALPPLRERPGDILPLADHLLERLGSVHGRPQAQLAAAARALLESYGWPGNVRELKNAIERALIFSKDSVLRPEDFPESIRAASPPTSRSEPGLRRAGAATQGAAACLRSLEEVERECIRATLEATRYKISQAAQILGISRKTLLAKRKKYGLA
jgi:DNA-binding NtrC family response regulator